MKKTLDAAAIALTALFLFALAVVSLLGMSDPHRASIGYGMPVSDASGALFYRVFVSRNLVLVASGAIFLVLRQWMALAILVSMTSTLAVFDMAILSHAGVTPPAFHAVTLIIILVTAALLWRRAAQAVKR
jgi:uncharacterized protein DUF4267